MISNEDVDDHSDEKQKIVSVINNNELYFYEGINPSSILLINKNIGDLSRHMLITRQNTFFQSSNSFILRRIGCISCYTNKC